MKKVLTRILIVIVSLVAILYISVFVGHHYIFKAPYSDVPTVKAIEQEGFTFGAASIKQPSTFDAYVQVAAKQVKNYQEHIESFWPNNPEKNQYLLIQNLKDKQSVLVTPKGEIQTLSKNEFKKYNVGFGLNTEGQWAPIQSNGISGAYIGVIPENLSNYYSFQKYEHLGTYDQFLSYSHELFHSITQERWAGAKLTVEAQSDRDERFEDSQARHTRMLLQQQLKNAIADEKQREEFTLAALRTYQTYQRENKEDFQQSKLGDRLEGTAYYYELVSSLYAGYPEQIQSQADVYKGLGILLANDNPAYRNTGLTSEGYGVGGYAGILLDLIAIEKNENPNQWKKIIEEDENVSTISLLEKAYSEKELPKQEEIPSEADYRKWQNENDDISPSSSKTTIIFDVLYGLLF
ncbi:hypothetical protein [Vagococcus silagei]|uniref:Uncharacterized protein n=1 Tax=Vagococcus silagei TaxID=2508885 RepID=A0A4S3B6V8_9ENTE|nr:hypothetical protein [Vagococcus silagei]THB62157.1 hypothetical protein ESZ54_01445 [Vagococcus silagei]